MMQRAMDLEFILLIIDEFILLIIDEWVFLSKVLLQHATMIIMLAMH
jgi:hypothetical protein